MAPDNYYAGFHWKEKKKEMKERKKTILGREGEAGAVTLAMFHYVLI